MRHYSRAHTPRGNRWVTATLPLQLARKIAADETLQRGAQVRPQGGTRFHVSTLSNRRASTRHVLRTAPAGGGPPAAPAPEMRGSVAVGSRAAERDKRRGFIWSAYELLLHPGAEPLRHERHVPVSYSVRARRRVPNHPPCRPQRVQARRDPRANRRLPRGMRRNDRAALRPAHPWRGGAVGPSFVGTTRNPVSGSRKGN